MFDVAKFHENSSWENSQECGFILFLNMNIVTNNLQIIWPSYLYYLSRFTFFYLVIKEMSIKTQCH